MAQPQKYERSHDFAHDEPSNIEVSALNSEFGKLFKNPLQFRLARTSNCHAGQITVTSLLKGTFEELPLTAFLYPSKASAKTSQSSRTTTEALCTALSSLRRLVLT